MNSKGNVSQQWSKTLEKILQGFHLEAAVIL